MCVCVSLSHSLLSPPPLRLALPCLNGRLFASLFDKTADDLPHMIKVKKREEKEEEEKEEGEEE